MPARDGTGPMGRGARTGGGFGNCATPAAEKNFPITQGVKQPLGRGRRLWKVVTGRIFNRKRGNLNNR